MQVSKQSANFWWRVLAASALVLLGFLVSDTISPRQTASAQNAGTVGIQAQMTPVFSTQASNACGAILPDIGQGQNTLFVSTTSFSGTVDLEWSPTKTAPFYPLVSANYVNETSTHNLYVGGYFPNLRACVSNRTLGSVSAWYSAISGPIPSSYAGLSSSGPTSPIVCDQNTTQDFAASSLAPIGTISPINSGETVAVCGFNIGFSAAPSSGALSFELFSGSACTGTEALNWKTPTTTATPQFLPIALQQRTFGPNVFACLRNTSTTAGTITVSWASVRL